MYPLPVGGSSLPRTEQFIDVFHVFFGCSRELLQFFGLYPLEYIHAPLFEYLPELLMDVFPLRGDGNFAEPSVGLTAFLDDVPLVFQQGYRAGQVVPVLPRIGGSSVWLFLP